MGGLLALPQFQQRFGFPTATMQGFMVASYDVSLSLLNCSKANLHGLIYEMTARLPHWLYTLLLLREYYRASVDHRNWMHGPACRRDVTNSLIFSGSIQW